MRVSAESIDVFMAQRVFKQTEEIIDCLLAQVTEHVDTNLCLKYLLAQQQTPHQQNVNLCKKYFYFENFFHTPQVK